MMTVLVLNILNSDFDGGIDIYVYDSNRGPRSRSVYNIF